MEVRGRMLDYNEQPTQFVESRAVSDADRLVKAFGDRLFDHAANCTSVRYIGLQRVTPNDVLHKYGDDAGSMIWLTLPKMPADIWDGVTVKTLVNWNTRLQVNMPPGPDAFITGMLPYNNERILQLQNVVSLVILRYPGPFVWTVYGFIGGPNNFNYTDQGFWQVFRQSLVGQGININPRRKVMYAPGNHNGYQWAGRFAVLMSESDVVRLETLSADAAGVPAHVLYGLRVQRADTTHYPRYIRLAQLPSANKGPTPIEPQLQSQFGISRTEARDVIKFLKQQTPTAAAADDSTACRRLV